MTLVLSKPYTSSFLQKMSFDRVSKAALRSRKAMAWCFLPSRFLIHCSCIEATAEKFKLKDWVVLQKQRKYELAGHICRREDGRWSTRLLHSTLPLKSVRRQGTPHKRWDDEFANHFGNWKDIAMDREDWLLFKSVFLQDNLAENF